MSTVMARISEEAREKLNELAELDRVSAAFYLTCLIEAAWSKHAQEVCPHEWETVTTGEGDNQVMRGVCTKCGKVEEE